MNRYDVTFVFLLVLISGCQVKEAPGPSQLEPCVALTGERDYEAVIIEHPPTIIEPGAEMTFRFSGGYYDVLPSCEKIGNSQVYHYPTSDELDLRTREVEIFLNNALIHDQECAYDCEITFLLSEEIETGSYPLTVRPDSWLYEPRDMQFVVEVEKHK